MQCNQYYIKKVIEIKGKGNTGGLSGLSAEAA